MRERTLTPQGSSTLGVGVPVDSWIFRGQFQGSKLNGLRRFLYQWKALRTYISKMGSYCPFEHLKHKLWPKEGPEVKLAIWLPTTKKSGIDPISTRADSIRHIIGKLSTRATTLLQISSQLEVCMWKLWESQSWQFRDSFPLGSPGTKSHLDVGPVERCRIYYKGKGGGFPQVQAVVSLVCPCCPWLVLAPKVLQLCTNHLVLVLCRSVWVSEACQFFLVSSWSSNTPLYPSKVLQTKERAPTPYSSALFCLGLTFESFKELGVCH